MLHVTLRNRNMLIAQANGASAQLHHASTACTCCATQSPHLQSVFIIAAVTHNDMSVVVCSRVTSCCSCSVTVLLPGLGAFQTLPSGSCTDATG
jgi:hypothetical protein